MTSQFDVLIFFYYWNDLDNNPSEFAKFGDEMCKICKISLNDRFNYSARLVFTNLSSFLPDCI